MDGAQPVALVTGAGRRLGQAIAADLAAHGWAVAIHYNRSRDEAEALAGAIAAAGGRAAVLRAELGEAAEARQLIGRTAAALGPATLLVNSAASFADDGIGRLDAGRWQRQIAVNLTAPVFLADAFAASLPAGAEGHIVNIVDQQVLRPMPRFFSYALAKSALWTATQMLAQALAPRIRVNAIGPGPVLPAEGQDPADFERQAAAVPLGHAPALADFGSAVRFLVATGSITGQMLLLDSGQHLAWRTADVMGASG
jgi:NAD(P)-dependent dehydrogenase (short-subunit alcohol dehydrogenase family)